MSAKRVVRNLNRSQATVACSVLTVLCGARQCRLNSPVIDDPLDDGDPTLRGTVYALIIIVLFCAMGVALGVVLGVG